MPRHAFTALCIIGCAAGFAPSVGSARAACAPLRMAGFGASVKTKKPKPAARAGIGKGQGPLEQWNTFAELRDAGARRSGVWARPAGSGRVEEGGRVACANGAAPTRPCRRVRAHRLERARDLPARVGRRGREGRRARARAGDRERAVSGALEAGADFARSRRARRSARAQGRGRARARGRHPSSPCTAITKDDELTHGGGSSRLGKGKKTARAGWAPPTARGAWRAGGGAARPTGPGDTHPPRAPASVN